MSTEKPTAKKSKVKKKLPKTKILPDKIQSKITKKARNFQFIDRAGTVRRLTDKQVKFCEEYLRLYGNGVDAIIEAGYDVFYRDKKGNKTDKVNYNLARSMATENLMKPTIASFITENLRKYGFDDENVELQHLFNINQFADLASKNRAIDMWYKLKNKYPAQKVEHSGKIDMIEVTNYAEPDQKETK